MIVCPVCEHQQSQGAVCENCGKQLVAPAPINVTREVLPELEATSIPGGNANVALDRMTDLEVHRAPDVPVAPESVPELERTAFAQAQVAAEQLTEIEPTHFAADGQKTVLSQVRTCRYCGNQQQQGAVCDRCGMRIAQFAPKKSEQQGNADYVPCPACGVSGATNKRCLACGAFIRRPEA